MKLVNFTADGHIRAGAIVNNQVIDLNCAYQAQLKAQGKYRYQEIAHAFVPASTDELFQGGKESLELAQGAIDFILENPDYSDKKAVYHRSEVKIEAPVQKPGKIICVGHNFRKHIQEMGREIPTHPVIFAKFANTIIGPEDDIPYYPISEQLDYEMEFAFVIGKQARNVSEEDALDYVAGYTIANDVTYRDIQRRTLQWLQGKTVDGSLPLGPHLVTADEIGDPAGLEMVLKVNGEVRQSTNTDDFVFNVPKLVSFLSGLLTLEPGDLILTGTPGGVGFAMNPPQFLKDGDVVTIEIEKIGVLENKVKAVKQPANV
ncbi:MAG: fumarylacetoacetate hydrolase family protein [Bacilli bacterium]|uniref:Fumarylacetoacetate hydrolase family protein n=1 Tax=Ureibacillus suwonensis TaxID=313007 RepID=A0ABW0RE93_9BACL|nr:FAA hydrolase family protein [Bacilli bacterium]